MININVNEEREFTFAAQIGGIQSDKLSTRLRMVIGEVEYGFPAEVSNETITVIVPPLKTVVSRLLNDGEEIKAKLEIVADGNYLMPWEETFKIINPLVVEARMVDGIEVSKKKNKDSVVLEQKEDEVSEKEISEKEVPSGDDLTESIVNKLAEKLSFMFEDKREKVKITEVKSKSTTPKKVSKKDLLKMTESDVYAYIERAGTKNPKIQKIIYEQAEAAAESSVPLNVLRQVVKILKKK